MNDFVHFLDILMKPRLWWDGWGNILILSGKMTWEHFTVFKPIYLTDLYICDQRIPLYIGIYIPT